MMRRPMILAAFLLPLPAMANDLMVVDAWIPTAPPSAPTHAAYVSVDNQTDHARVLVKVSSDNFTMTHLHESKETDGVATMSMLHQIEIPAGGMLTMKPGGLHIMLMGAKASVTEGALIPLTLEFANGDTIAVDALVKRHDPNS